MKLNLKNIKLPSSFQILCVGLLFSALGLLTNSTTFNGLGNLVIILSIVYKVGEIKGKSDALKS